MTGALPSAAECRRLWSTWSARPDLVAHVEAVHQAATAIARRILDQGHAVDHALVEAGALLHDVGRLTTQGIDHASVGAQRLRAMGLDERLCRVVERHTGAGIDAAEAQALGLPVRDYTPVTLEEKVVCHADNLVDGHRRQKVQEELEHLRGRGLDRVAAKMRRLHDELSRLAGRDLDEIL